MKSPAGEFYVKRSVSIAASEAAVFELISNLHHWELWNPQLRADSRTQRTYNDVTHGTGAVATWSGPRNGSGKLEITRATPSREVIVIVNFERPFKVQNLNTFELSRDGSCTVVTWSMRGPKPFLAKLLSLVINMDKSLARHFDAGLAQLKAIAESAARSADS